jgi:hypothetical protein
VLAGTLDEVPAWLAPRPVRETRFAAKTRRSQACPAARGHDNAVPREGLVARRSGVDVYARARKTRRDYRADLQQHIVLASSPSAFKPPLR